MIILPLSIVTLAKKQVSFTLHHCRKGKADRENNFEPARRAQRLQRNPFRGDS